jgi:hypothetical protein
MDFIVVTLHHVLDWPHHEGQTFVSHTIHEKLYSKSMNEETPWDVNT